MIRFGDIRLYAGKLTLTILTNLAMVRILQEKAFPFHSILLVVAVSVFTVSLVQFDGLDHHFGELVPNERVKLQSNIIGVLLSFISIMVGGSALVVTNLLNQVSMHIIIAMACLLALTSVICLHSFVTQLRGEKLYWEMLVYFAFMELLISIIMAAMFSLINQFSSLGNNM